MPKGIPKSGTRAPRKSNAGRKKKFATTLTPAKRGRPAGSTKAKVGRPAKAAKYPTPRESLVGVSELVQSIVALKGNVNVLIKAHQASLNFQKASLIDAFRQMYLNEREHGRHDVAAAIERFTDAFSYATEVIGVDENTLRNAIGAYTSPDLEEIERELEVEPEDTGITDEPEEEFEEVTTDSLNQI